MMKTVTKIEILAGVTGRHLSQVNEGCFNMAVSESLRAMQEFSDQQTVNLKLINEKQKELIEKKGQIVSYLIKIILRNVSKITLRYWESNYIKNYPDTCKRLESELSALQEQGEKEEDDKIDLSSPDYHLNCQWCGDPFWTKNSTDTACEKCYEHLKSKG